MIFNNPKGQTARQIMNTAIIKSKYCEQKKGKKTLRCSYIYHYVQYLQFSVSTLVACMDHHPSIVVNNNLDILVGLALTGDPFRHKFRTIPRSTGLIIPNGAGNI